MKVASLLSAYPACRQTAKVVSQDPADDSPRLQSAYLFLDTVVSVALFLESPVPSLHKEIQPASTQPSTSATLTPTARERVMPRVVTALHETAVALCDTRCWARLSAFSNRVEVTARAVPRGITVRKV